MSKTGLFGPRRVEIYAVHGGHPGKRLTKWTLVRKEAFEALKRAQKISGEGGGTGGHWVTTYPFDKALLDGVSFSKGKLPTCKRFPEVKRLCIQRWEEHLAAEKACRLRNLAAEKASGMRWKSQSV